MINDTLMHVVMISLAVMVVIQSVRHTESGDAFSIFAVWFSVILALLNVVMLFQHWATGR